MARRQCARHTLAPKSPTTSASLISIASGGHLAMKNIVICCDGTGNEISENISNVLKL